MAPRRQPYAGEGAEDKAARRSGARQADELPRSTGTSSAFCPRNRGEIVKQLGIGRVLAHDAPRP
jgi:hypothetical protein